MGEEDVQAGELELPGFRLDGESREPAQPEYMKLCSPGTVRDKGRGGWAERCLGQPQWGGERPSDEASQGLLFLAEEPGNMWPSHWVNHPGRRQQTPGMNWSFWAGKDLG